MLVKDIKKVTHGRLTSAALENNRFNKFEQFITRNLFSSSSKLLIFEQRDLKHSKLCNYSMSLNWLQPQVEPEQVQHCVWAVMEKQLVTGHSLTRFSSNMFTAEMLLSYEDIFTLWSEVNRYSFLWRYCTLFNKWVISLLYYTTTKISRDIKLLNAYAHTHKV